MGLQGRWNFWRYVRDSHDALIIRPSQIVEECRLTLVQLTAITTIGIGIENMLSRVEGLDMDERNDLSTPAFLRQGMKTRLGTKSPG